jgi:hypothetical protein
MRMKMGMKMGKGMGRGMGTRKGIKIKTLLNRINKKRGALGVDQILAVTAAVIVVGLVLIPGLRSFGEAVIAKLQSWWTTVSATIFAST